MTVSEKSAKITVDLGDRDLYRRLRHASIEADMTVREIVIEAVQFWLDHQEVIESYLGAEAMEALKANDSGDRVSHEEVKRRLRL